MEEKKEVDILKSEIERKRRELNNIILKERDKELIVKFSQELDLLINQFYNNTGN